MNYTAEQKRIAKQLARQVQRAANIAGENNLEMGNGGDISSMLGGIASELEQISTQVEAPVVSEEAVPKGHGCPACGEARLDMLEWKDDETVVCGSCGNEYKP